MSTAAFSAEWRGVGRVAMTDFREYQDRSRLTAVFDGWGDVRRISYVSLGLTNEAGEAAGEIEKFLRDDTCAFTSSRRDKVVDECGDVLWYLSRVLEEAGSSLEEAAEKNLEKVHRRLANGTLQGSGDR